MKTIIAGSRHISRHDFDDAMGCLCDFAKDITAADNGCARGVDQHGEDWAREHNLPIYRFPADWERYGASAGPVRNAEMARAADALVAIWDGQSRGTKDMIAKAQALGLKVRVHIIGGPSELEQVPLGLWL